MDQQKSGHTTRDEDPTNFAIEASRGSKPKEMVHQRLDLGNDDLNGKIGRMLDSESITEGLTATLEIPAIPLLNGSSLALHQYARSGAEGPERAVTTAERAWLRRDFSSPRLHEASFGVFMHHVLKQVTTPTRPTPSNAKRTTAASSKTSPTALFDKFLQHVISNAFPEERQLLAGKGGAAVSEETQTQENETAGSLEDVTRPYQEDMMTLLGGRASELSDDAVVAMGRRLFASRATGPESARFMVIHAGYLFTRFSRSGSKHLLDEAITLYQVALGLHLKADSGRPDVLESLLTCLNTRFEQAGSGADLDDLILLQRERLESLPSWHPNRLEHISLLSNYIARRCYAAHAPADDDHIAIAYLARDALHLIPQHHRLYSSFLNNIMVGLGKIAFCEVNWGIIDLYRELLELRPNFDSIRGRISESLANWLLHRSDQLQDHVDRLEAIRLFREAEGLLLDSHSEGRFARLTNLANALTNEIKRTGNGHSYMEVVQLRREALKICPPEFRTTMLNNLAQSLQARFGQSGDMQDLTEAVSLLRQADQRRSNTLAIPHVASAHLANALARRFLVTKDLSDLSEATQLYPEALKVCPQDARSTLLSNLASCHLLHFRETGIHHNLGQAIGLSRKALEAAPEDGTYKLQALCNLASCLGSGMMDREEAVSLYRRALNLCNKYDPNRIPILKNLAVTLAEPYQALKPAMKEVTEQLIRHPNQVPTDVQREFVASLFGQQDRPTLGSVENNDLREAIGFYCEALELCPDGHPDRAEILLAWAGTLLDRWIRTDGSDPLILISWEVTQGSNLCRHKRGPTTPQNLIINMAREAANVDTAPTRMRLAAALTWMKFARISNDESVVEAASVSVNLFDLAVTRTASLEARYRRTSDGPELISLTQEAVAISIHSGDLSMAVTLLEQGRAVIFKQLGRYRTTVDKIREIKPEVAERFSQICCSLDGLVVNSGQPMRTGSPSALPPYDDATTSFHTLSMKWNEALDEIRATEGFESFLLPPRYDQLRRAAEAGPVVVVNVDFLHSAAIIVLHNTDPIVVPLPLAAYYAVVSVTDRLGARPATTHDDEMVQILQELWRIIVGPVVEKLEGPALKLRAGSRLWWCPTGAASRLPLHAAGPYTNGQMNLPQIFPSSYTPTLGALIRAREFKSPSARTGVPSLLVVSQPATPGQAPLASAIKEMQSVQKYAPHAVPMLGACGSRDSVVAGLADHAWLHLACHGHSSTANPFLSHFALHDGPLTLRDIIQKDLPQADLAYLSACHSAKVSDESPDEVLHLAAGMMFAGYRGVVGTMWALDDDIGSMVADEFYRLMLGHKRGPKDCSQAAIALAKAVEKLPEWVPLAQRITLVHFGI